jgi:hypothetical protein
MLFLVRRQYYATLVAFVGTVRDLQRLGHLALRHPGRLAQLPHPRDKRDLIFPRCQRRAIAVELAVGSTTND